MEQQPQVKVTQQVSVMKKIGLGIAFGLAGIAATGFFAVIAISSIEDTDNPEVPAQATLQDCVQIGNYCRHHGNSQSCWNVANACVRYVFNMNDR